MNSGESRNLESPAASREEEEEESASNLLQLDALANRVNVILGLLEELDPRQNQTKAREEFFQLTEIAMQDPSKRSDCREFVKKKRDEREKIKLDLLCEYRDTLQLKRLVHLHMDTLDLLSELKNLAPKCAEKLAQEINRVFDSDEPCEDKIKKESALYGTISSVLLAAQSAAEIAATKTLADIGAAESKESCSSRKSSGVSSSHSRLWKECETPIAPSDASGKRQSKSLT